VRQSEQLRYLVLAAQREGNRRLAEALRGLGLTPAQSEALRIVADHGPLPLKQLGAMLVCDTGASPSRIVDRLVTGGLVQRDTAEHDRREVRLSLTPLGRTRADQAAAVEDELSDAIDRAAVETDLSAVIGFLRTVTAGSAAARAFDRRLAAKEQRRSGS
jgi:DNA-binding MarR family transcriptional regulator